MSPEGTDGPEPADETGSTAASAELPAVDPGSLAGRLRYLFDTVRKPDGKRYTYREVIDAIAGYGISPPSIGYLSNLVVGTRTNPMLDTVQGLARFFGVPINYFDVTYDETETKAQLRLAAALKNAGVEDVALRAVGLSGPSLEILTDLVDSLRKRDGLPQAQTGAELMDSRPPEDAA